MVILISKIGIFFVTINNVLHKGINLNLIFPLNFTYLKLIHKNRTLTFHEHYLNLSAVGCTDFSEYK